MTIGEDEDTTPAGEELRPFALPPNTGKKTVVLTAISGSAGSGKSTWAAAVAYAAAQAGRTVVVIGGDRQRDVSKLLGYDDPDGDPNLATLYDVVKNGFTLDEAAVSARDTQTGKYIPNLWVVVESAKLDRLVSELSATTAREMWLHRLMPQLRGRVDIVIFDCPGNLETVSVGGMVACDQLVGCTKSQEKESRGLTELEEKLAEVSEAYGHVGMPKEVTWVVITDGVGHDSKGKVYRDIENQVRDAYGEAVANPTIKDDVKIPEAYSAGQPVTLYAPRSQAARAYTAIGRQMELYC